MAEPVDILLALVESHLAQSALYATRCEERGPHLDQPAREVLRAHQFAHRAAANKLLKAAKEMQAAADVRVPFEPISPEWRDVIKGKTPAGVPASEPKLDWCQWCGEGVTTFCRGALTPCPKGLAKATASGVPMVSTARVSRPEKDGAPGFGSVPAAGNPTLGELIAKVGGRINDAGYVEFGSEMAVAALVRYAVASAQPFGVLAVDQRQRFEAWADDQGFPLKRLETSDGYLDLRTHGAWDAWQAALTDGVPAAPGGDELPTLIKNAHTIADMVHRSDDGPIEALHQAIDMLVARIPAGVPASRGETVSRSNADGNQEALEG